MVLQSLLLIAGDLDNVKQTEKVRGRSNGAAEPVADCLPRIVSLRHRSHVVSKKVTERHKTSLPGAMALHAAVTIPYWARHFRSGRRGLVVWAAGFGACDRVVIWFPDTRNYEWRHGSAFVRDRDNEEAEYPISEPVQP